MQRGRSGVTYVFAKRSGSYGSANFVQRGRSGMTFVFANDVDYMNEQFAKGTMQCYMFWSSIVIIIISINRNNYANISSARAPAWLYFDLETLRSFSRNLHQEGKGFLFDEGQLQGWQNLIPGEKKWMSKQLDGHCHYIGHFHTHVSSVIRQRCGLGR